jgi:hypothetical protein
MKILAAKRLNALRIVPQEEAYSESDGQFSLRIYNEFVTRLIKTNLPGYEIAITKNPEQSYYIESYLVHEGKAVGLVGITQSHLNNKKGRIYAPSSYFDPKHRGLGYAKALYRWILNSGTNLVTKNTQSKFSNALWHSLAKEFQMIEVLDDAITENKEADPHTRLILLGKGNTKDELIREFDLADHTVYG